MVFQNITAPPQGRRDDISIDEAFAGYDRALADCRAADIRFETVGTVGAVLDDINRQVPGLFPGDAKSLPDYLEKLVQEYAATHRFNHLHLTVSSGLAAIETVDATRAGYRERVNLDNARQDVHIVLCGLESFDENGQSQHILDRLRYMDALLQMLATTDMLGTASALGAERARQTQAIIQIKKIGAQIAALRADIKDAAERKRPPEPGRIKDRFIKITKGLERLSAQTASPQIRRVLQIMLRQIKDLPRQLPMLFKPAPLSPLAARNAFVMKAAAPASTASPARALFAQAKTGIVSAIGRLKGPAIATALGLANIVAPSKATGSLSSLSPSFLAAPSSIALAARPAVISVAAIVEEIRVAPVSASAAASGLANAATPSDATASLSSPVSFSSAPSATDAAQFAATSAGAMESARIDLPAQPNAPSAEVAAPGIAPAENPVPSVSSAPAPDSVLGAGGGERDAAGDRGDPVLEKPVREQVGAGQKGEAPDSGIQPATNLNISGAIDEERNNKKNPLPHSEADARNKAIVTEFTAANLRSDERGAGDKDTAEKISNLPFETERHSSYKSYVTSFREAASNVLGSTFQFIGDKAQDLLKKFSAAAEKTGCPKGARKCECGKEQIELERKIDPGGPKTVSGGLAFINV